MSLLCFTDKHNHGLNIGGVFGSGPTLLKLGEKMDAEREINWFECLPFAVAVLRVEDQVVVSANLRALELFGASASQLGTVTLWDIVAEIDWNELGNLATRGAREGRDWEDSTVGLITFRRTNKTEFVAWVLASAIYDEDGVVRHRAAVILNESMNQ